MATKTAADYAKELYSQSQPSLASQFEAKKSQSDKTYQQIAEAINKSTAAGVAKYQESMDAAPAESQKLYDENAVTEAVSRKQVQESMANMGMTDSGLSSSLQTSLAVARGNADAKVRQQEQAYVQQLKAAIDDLVSSGETQKSVERMTLDKELDDWYQNQQADLWKQSLSAGADQYAAEQDAAARVMEAQYEALNKSQEKAVALAKMLLESGGYTDAGTALRDAYGYYGLNVAEPDAEEEVDTVANAAIQFADKMDLNTSWWTWLSNQDGDGDAIYRNILKELSGNTEYAKLTPQVQTAVKAAAVAKSVAQKWNKPSDKEDNLRRVEVAAEKLGIPTDVALEYYNRYYSPFTSHTE